MVPGRPDKPAEPDPNPQSFDTDCSQSRDWGHHGCLGHFQVLEGVVVTRQTNGQTVCS